MVQLKIAVLRIESVSIRPSTVGSFWSYVDKPTLRACWPWMGGCNDYPKLTEDALTAIAAAVEAGENRRAVADRYGIHVSNLYRAIQRVSEPDPVFEPLIAQADYMDQQRAARRAKK